MKIQDPAMRDRGFTPPSLGHTMGWALAVGTSAGALSAATDLLAAKACLAPSDAVQIVLLGAAIGVIPALCVFGAATVLVRLLRTRAKLDLLMVCLAGAAFQMALALVLSGRQLLWTAPLPWAAAGVSYWIAGRPGAHGWAVGIVMALLLSLIAALCTSFLAAGSILRWPLVIAMVLVGLLAAPRAKSRPWLVLGCFAVATVLTQWNHRSPAWVELPSQALAGKELATTPRIDPALHPNVVLIVLDTTRADHLGCYGSDQGLTPNLDALAAESVLFEHAIAPAPWTVPSHASLFTGLYPISHGCDTIPHRWLDDGFDTIAELLAELGYQTVGLVANGYLVPSNLLQGINQRLMIDMDSAHRGTRTYKWMSKAGAPERWSDQGAAEGVTALGQWLEQDRAPGRPFYLFVNLMEAHWPMHPPFSWRRRCLPDGVGLMEATRASRGFYGPKWMAGQRRTARQEEIICSLYAADVAYQDSQLGALISTLRQTGELDKTILIITADHGENLGEGGRWDHVFAVNDKLIHVPLIVRYPLRFPPGRRIIGQCQLVDILPTLCSLIPPLRAPEALPGLSLVPDQFSAREFTFAEVHPYYGHLERMESVTGFAQDTARFLAHYRAIRSDQFKFVWSSHGDHKLYDVIHDPREELDLSSDKPEIAAAMAGKLAEWLQSQPLYEPKPGPEGRPIDPGILNSLKSLGYVGD